MDFLTFTESLQMRNAGCLNCQIHLASPKAHTHTHAGAHTLPMQTDLTVTRAYVLFRDFLFLCTTYTCNRELNTS